MVTQTLGAKIQHRIDDDLFDDLAGYDEEVGVQFAPNLTEEEQRQAKILYHLFNELWGVCLVVGDPGQGKDVFGNYIAYKVKRFFPHKRILRDEKPRKLFGTYAGLFNESVLSEDLSRMRELAKGVSATGAGKVLEEAAGAWVTDKGEVLLKSSLLYLTEYGKYCYHRNPMNPMNTTMGAVHRQKRHLDCLVVGTNQLASDLDKKTCLPWIDWVVTCTRSATNPTGFVYYVRKVKYDKRKSDFQFLPTLGRQGPFPIAFDAGSPRTYLGDGKIRIKKPHYRPETEEERIVLDVLRSGVDTYEELVDVLATYGDMSENEVLATLKELKFRKHKRVIDYPCFFGLYNSKSAPQIKTALKVEE